jgi:hypothetical protein
VRSAGGSQNRLAHTGAMRYDNAVTKIPAAAVSFEDAETIAYLAKMGTVKIKLLLRRKLCPTRRVLTLSPICAAAKSRRKS